MSIVPGISPFSWPVLNFQGKFAEWVNDLDLEEGKQDKQDISDMEEEHSPIIEDQDVHTSLIVLRMRSSQTKLNN